MKKLQCELCGSVDIIKIAPDVFQCQYCGCKYTAEQVKTIIAGEVVARTPDFEIVGGKLIKYHGSSPEVIIPNNVSIIGKHSFKDCSGIMKVSIPDSVKKIEDSAFSGCSSLQNITISESVLAVGELCFTNCHSLKSIVIPDSVNSIGDYCFEGCKSLESIKLSSGITELKWCIFEGCESLKELSIPEGIKELTFRGRQDDKTIGIKTLTLPYSLQKVDGRLPKNVTSLEGNTQLYFRTRFDANTLNNLCREWNPNEGWGTYSIVDQKYRNKIIADRQTKGVCLNCGGRFKGVFNKVCSNCGKEKNY